MVAVAVPRFPPVILVCRDRRAKPRFLQVSVTVSENMSFFELVPLIPRTAVYELDAFGTIPLKPTRAENVAVTVLALPPLAGKPTQFNANQLRNIPGTQSDEEAKIGSEGSTDDSFDWSFLSGIIPGISPRVIPGQNQKALNKDNPVWQDSNAGKGLTPVEPYSDLSSGKFVATPDRWRLSKDLNLITESFLDPYNRNPIKGDRPFYRDYFFNFTGISDSLFEYRNVPTPVSSQLSAEDLDASGDQLDLNGKGKQFFFNENWKKKNIRKLLLVMNHFLETHILNLKLDFINSF